MKPLVSVIIPNYNYARYVGEAVESALAQTYPNIEIIVVDDGSTDASLESLSQFSDRIKIVAQPNQGVCVARNQGVAGSNGVFVAFLDADDVWYPTKIEKQISRFDSEKGLGMVHVGVREVNSSGVVLKERLEGMEGYVAEHLILFEGEGGVLGGGSGLMVPRKIFDEVNGFDTKMSTSADWEFFYRVAAKNKVGFVPEILLDYRMHDSNMHSNVERFESEMLYAFDKIRRNGGMKRKRRCYGNLHKILAGSYFRAAKYKQFGRHAMHSLLNKPSNISYFLMFPFRKLSRNSSGKKR